MYDIAVIGAGPAGSYAAYQAAKAGLKVIVIEEHPSVGEPSFCAGIVGQEMFERLGLPTGSIQNRLQTAVIHSPGGRQARLTSSRVRINIIDRIAFDREISHMAMDLGASFLISARCTDISLPGDGVKLKLSLRGKNTVEIKAKACILAAGVSYSLHKKIGLPVPEKFLDCAQTEVGVKKPVSCIEIYLGRNVAPCSFAWAVPVGPRRIRVGVSANRQAPAYLKKLLGSKRLKDNIKDRHPAIRRRIIPIDAISKTYAERLLVVGDAAGQVKPITGGGIFYGLLCSKIAADTLITAFKKKDFSRRALRGYDTRWRRMIGFELSVGRFIRRFMDSLTDSGLDALVEMMGENGQVRRIIENSRSFDWHKEVVLSLLRAPALSARVYKRLLRDILRKNSPYA